MYFIPKNIKVKKEIFKGFGILEIIVITISMGLGYLLSLLGNNIQIKVFMFSVLPIITFLLLIPLPNHLTAWTILIKFFNYQNSQKKYKKYN